MAARLIHPILLLCTVVVLASCGASGNTNPERGASSAGAGAHPSNAEAHVSATATAADPEQATSDASVDRSAGGPATTATAANAGAAPAEVEPDPQQVTVSAKEFTYSRKVIKASIGQPMTVTLQNEGHVVHDWVVKELNVGSVEVIAERKGNEHGSRDHASHQPEEHGGTPSGGESQQHEAHDHGDASGTSQHGDHDSAALHVAVTPGGKSSIVFTPMEAGTFEFFCSVPGHRDAGMHGQLVVQE